MAEAAPRRLERPDGHHIAYHDVPGSAPGVLFLGGFMSDMTGTKALALDAFCRRRGQAFTRFDYLGHGASSGRFEDGTIGRWRDDAVAVLDHMAPGPRILVGSSMGGWIMLLAALARPERVRAMVGLAAAPDFTEDLLWSAFDEATRERLMREGVVTVPSDYDDGDYPITRALIEDGRRHLVMRGPIPLTCPTRLIQGMRDADVPWRTALDLAAALESADVETTLVKNGDHRLSEAADLDCLFATIDALRGHDHRSAPTSAASPAR